MLSLCDKCQRTVTSKVNILESGVVLIKTCPDHGIQTIPLESNALFYALTHIRGHGVPFWHQVLNFTYAPQDCPQEVLVKLHRPRLREALSDMQTLVETSDPNVNSPAHFLRNPACGCDTLIGEFYAVEMDWVPGADNVFDVLRSIASYNYAEFITNGELYPLAKALEDYCAAWDLQSTPMRSDNNPFHISFSIGEGRAVRLRRRGNRDNAIVDYLNGPPYIWTPKGAILSHALVEALGAP